jgi:hypothetical protein
LLGWGNGASRRFKIGCAGFLPWPSGWAGSCCVNVDALWVGLVGMDRRGCLGQRPFITGTRDVTTEWSALVGVKRRSRATTGQPSKVNGASMRGWTRGAGLDGTGHMCVVAVWEKPLLVRCGEKVTLHWHNGRWARRGSRSIPSPFPDFFLRSHALEGHRRQTLCLVANISIAAFCSTRVEYCTDYSGALVWLPRETDVRLQSGRPRARDASQLSSKYL